MKTAARLRRASEEACSSQLRQALQHLVRGGNGLGVELVGALGLDHRHQFLDDVHVAGIYEVSVTDANGCMDTAVATIVNVECLCEADFTEDAHCMQEPVKFVLLADSVIMDSRWEFADAVGGSSAIDPLVKFNKEGEVQVTLQATLGCGVVTVERTIRLVDCTKECSVFIPNTFTPNNDHINDDWSCPGRATVGGAALGGVQRRERGAEPSGDPPTSRIDLRRPSHHKPPLRAAGSPWRL